MTFLPTCVSVPFCKDKFICASLKIFISACVSLLAATSALSSLYPDIILQDTIIMSRPLVWLFHAHIICSVKEQRGREEEGEGGKVDFHFHDLTVIWFVDFILSSPPHWSHIAPPFFFVLSLSVCVFSFCLHLIRASLLSFLFPPSPHFLPLSLPLLLLWSIFFLVCLLFDSLINSPLVVFTWLFFSLLSCFSFSSLST